MFSDTTHGAKASAALYSLIETAKANGVEPYGYLKPVITEILETGSVDGLTALLPWEYKRNILRQ
jgi:transposase